MAADDGDCLEIRLLELRVGRFHTADMMKVKKMSTNGVVWQDRHYRGDGELDECFHLVAGFHARPFCALRHPPWIGHPRGDKTSTTTSRSVGEKMAFGIKGVIKHGAY